MKKIFFIIMQIYMFKYVQLRWKSTNLRIYHSVNNKSESELTELTRSSNKIKRTIKKRKEKKSSSKVLTYHVAYLL